jgi:hypothetical protein
MKNKMNKKNKMKPCRQGDVLVVPVDSFPDGLTKTDRVTLALGEVTGHHHSIAEGCIGYAFNGNAAGLAEYFEVTADKAVLTHQEHDPITFPTGKYQAIRQVEYTPAGLAPVGD